MESDVSSKCGAIDRIGLANSGFPAPPQLHSLRQLGFVQEDVGSKPRVTFYRLGAGDTFQVNRQNDKSGVYYYECAGVFTLAGLHIWSAEQHQSILFLPPGGDSGIY